LHSRSYRESGEGMTELVFAPEDFEEKGTQHPQINTMGSPERKIAARLANTKFQEWLSQGRRVWITGYNSSGRCGHPNIYYEQPSWGMNSKEVGWQEYVRIKIHGE